MSEDQVKNFTADRRRRIIVADDEAVNRELLGMVLEQDYEVLYAEDGIEALRIIRENRDTISLVLLDLMMPGMSGQEVLRSLKAGADTKKIPVIVVTADQSAEIECLGIGAIDFIPKPYPQAGVILARVLRTIELSEDRDTIQSTQTDPLTGLYNREFFYRYAVQHDLYRKETVMDAVIIDINHFHMINERFGNAHGDEVLRALGRRISEEFGTEDAIICRREADTFLVYCPHREDYETVLNNISSDFTDDTSSHNPVRIRIGVYSSVDKTIEVERRFDRAKMAADSVRNNYAMPIGTYDSTLHERELYAERLIGDFQAAIRGRQFVVYYQPKFDITQETLFLYGAEALVRWMHPDLGMVSPGVFIPLFEENGLIQELDIYVWNETARQIAQWKKDLGVSVPVSVNVSRIDMYDPNLAGKLLKIVDDTGITVRDLHLEITESAYTQDSEQIIDMTTRLRRTGFFIEMDDFGTGYSSLNMLSDLPLDAMKLDMQFIRRAFKENRDTRMLEVIIDIAGRLKVPTIAEGVETEEQVRVLRELKCSAAQGFYFSKPVPAADFEKFLLSKKSADEDQAAKLRELDRKEVTADEPAPEESQASAKGSIRERGIRLRTISYLFAAAAFIIALLLLLSDHMITRYYHRMEEASDRYIDAKQAAMDLEAGSDYLTNCIRRYSVTGDPEAVSDFFEEVNTTKRRDNALSSLYELLGQGGSGTGSAYESLETALNWSNELLVREYHAIRLAQTAYGLDDSAMPEAIRQVELTDEELSMTDRQQKEAAIQLVFDSEYEQYKENIRENVSQCTDRLIDDTRSALAQTESNLDRILSIQTVLTMLLLLLVLTETVFISLQVRKPLTRMVAQMKKQEQVPLSGVAELQFVTQTYNEILEENHRTREQLTYEATHDALTGLFNRSAFEMFMDNVDAEHIAVMLIDVDEFKTINDTYGHDVGDKVLRYVAKILKQSFRSVDVICRFGGDEFVVILTRADSSMKEMVINKIAHINELLQSKDSGLPRTSVSVGVAFADRKNPQNNIMKDADMALYRVKEKGRCGCEVFG